MWTGRKPMRKRKIERIGVLSVAVLLTVGCDGLLEVTNPGPIADEDLNTPAAMPALVVGMAADLSVALSTTTIWGSVWSDDLTHSGTLGAPTIFSRGIIEPSEVNGWWGSAHRARWVAEEGIERMREVLGGNFESSPLASHGYLLAGFANRILGENACEAVFNGGPAEPHSVHFERAEDQFTEALRLASARGAADHVTAAHAGRAQVRAAQGNWDGAVQDASQVPIDFVHEAVYSLNTSRENNGWSAVTLVRGEYSVWESPWYEVEGDSRIPWEEVLAAGGNIAPAANGTTPWVRQQKYLSDGDNIALAKGDEMVLIRAEAALRGGDAQQAVSLMNEVRAHHGLEAVAGGSPNEVWPLLHFERGATLWLEGRRFWDLRRWHEESGPAHHPWLSNRDRCVPVSEFERLSNPNIP
jgi:starch-binding outer membrane protein, SusD/RagB family